MRFISSNHFSFEDQVNDALSHLRSEHPEQYQRVAEGAFSTLSAGERTGLDDGDSWKLVHAKDDEAFHWTCDDIEIKSEVQWQDGEPVCFACS